MYNMDNIHTDTQYNVLNMVTAGSQMGVVVMLPGLTEHSMQSIGVDLQAYNNANRFK